MCPLSGGAAGDGAGTGLQGLWREGQRGVWTLAVSMELPLSCSSYSFPVGGRECRRSVVFVGTNEGTSSQMLDPC